MPTHSNRAAGVESAFRLKVCLASILWRGEEPEAMLLTKGHDLRYPTVTALGNAEESRGIIGSGSALVLPVQDAIGFAKIADPVVVPDPVHMVDLIDRPNVVDVEPREAVSEIVSAANANAEVSVWPIVPGGIANLDAVRRSDKPSKYARCGIVVQDAAKVICGKLFDSHDRPLSTFVVRGRAAFSASFGLAYCTRRNY